MSSISSTNSNASHVHHPGPLPTDDEDKVQTNELKECIENDTDVEAKHRVAFLLGVGLSVIDSFSIDCFQEDPFKSYKGKKNKPTRSKDCAIL